MRLEHAGALLLVGLAAMAAGGAEAAAPRGGQAWNAARRLEVDAGDRARVTFSPVTGTADLVVLEPGAISLSGSTPTARSLDFIARYKELFGNIEPYTDLEPSGRLVDGLGRTHLRYRQLLDGLPVFGGELHAHFDGAGQLTSVSGRLLPDVQVSNSSPTLSAATAEDIAATALAKSSGRSVAMLTVSPARLLVYRTGLLAGRPGADHLAWAITVAADAATAETVVVDAHDGVILERIPRAYDLTRSVAKTTPGNVIWKEGDPLPYGGDSADANQEINQLITTAGESYQLFASLSGGTFLSWDGHEAAMPTLYDPNDENLGDTECPNAFWTSADRRMTVCTGMATDDVVAHEWTHAYTDATDGLVYMWQSGALNESFSDIFGETLDQLNGLGMDSPDRHRTDGACSAYGFGLAPELTIDSPASLAGPYFSGSAQFNPAPPFSVTARVELANDGTDPTGDACEPLTGFTPGRIALIDRGDCNFVDKARRAEDAGAVGVIVANNQGDTLLNMAGSDGSTLSIPSVFITESDGDAIKAALGGNVTATIALDVAASDQSVRWLVAEGAQTGALRDMWNPDCFNDPGRVRDPDYSCSYDDNGAVHSNSGVPNHAFALMADGGAYNGRTVRGIGLVKAINIYWRAMSVYQIPVTDFAMHADFVQQSCRDLVGAPLPDPTTGAVSGQVISADDCAQVTSAMIAVEMSVPPDQCSYPPLLKTAAPAFIGNRIAFSESFDQGPPTGWKLSNEGVYAEYTPRNWAWTDRLPSGGRGGAYLAADSPTVGDCVAGSDDQSGVMRLTSPEIAIPAGASPTLAFDHWVATERRFDGGVVEISVNGGAFQSIDREAFTYNPYNLLLEAAGNGNTNPLAGQYAFTGTNTGSSQGSWGQSQVDLSGLVSEGDSVRVRFEFGVDGCGGVVGWYVDNVQVRTTDLTPRDGHARIRP